MISGSLVSRMIETAFTNKKGYCSHADKMRLYQDKPTEAYREKYDTECSNSHGTGGEQTEKDGLV